MGEIEIERERKRIEKAIHKKESNIGNKVTFTN